jgi:hypothetical protein
MVSFRSRAFLSDGVVWHIWPSVLGTDVGCRPVKVRDLGPPRFFLHSQTGEFCVVPHADASWESLAQLSEETLRAWASALAPPAGRDISPE